MDIQELYEEAIRSSVWKGAPIEAEPEIILHSWSIRKATDGNHFVGARNDWTGRVSTSIVTFDKDTLKGVTESGRVYQLVGPEGASSNAEYVWSVYKDINKIEEIKE